MILNVISFKNKVINAFTRPEFLDVEPEKAATQLARSILVADKPEVIKQYENLDMYCIGTFDDETGIFEQLKDPVCLLDCSKVIEQKEKKDGE